MTRLDIGFVGLGVMGSHMAGHLARAGHALTLMDADAAIARRLAQSFGGSACAVATPREVAQRSDVVITMLPNGQVVQQVALGEDGLLHGIREGAVLLDTSSSEPWLTRQTAQALAARGAAMVDAPVSGAEAGARDAALVFMVGGAEDDVARIRPLLDLMGRDIFHMGELGCGHAMKCINNCITAATMSAASEGLAVGKRYGLDPALMLDVLNLSTGGSWVTRTQFQRVLDRRFDASFKLELMLKDIGIAMELARETHTPVPMWSVGQQLWRMADRAAGEGASLTEVVRWVEQQSGIEITPGNSPGKASR